MLVSFDVQYANDKVGIHPCGVDNDALEANTAWKYIYTLPTCHFRPTTTKGSQPTGASLCPIFGPFLKQRERSG
jgi:hypothetical protein